MTCALALCACSSPPPTSSTTGGATAGGSSSTGFASSGGHEIGTTGGSGTGGSTGHASTGATTGSASTGGTSGIADAGTCLQCYPGSPCPLSDGGAGTWCNAYTVGSVCVDPSRDPLNCGGCGNACWEGQVCVPFVNGFPGCAYTNCAQAAPGGDNGYEDCLLPDGGQGGCCGGVCRDATSFYDDSANCGLCGYACPLGQSCSDGVCPSICDGNCPPGYDCTTDGLCLPACDGGNDGVFCDLEGGFGVCCQGACRDLSHDPTSCGACGLPCPAGTVCAHSLCLPAATCTAQADGLSCDLGGGRQGACCGQSCVDTTSDPANCGSCGTACPSGFVCLPSDVGVVSSTVYDALCILPDGGFPETCPPGACPGTVCEFSSPPGLFCASPSCTGLPLGSSCLAGPATFSECCSDGCTDVTEDPANCGFCGNVCESGMCVGGDCLPTSAAGLPASCGPFGGGPCPLDGGVGLCCGDPDDRVDCVDVAGDPANCGGCGQACPVGQSCVRGACSGLPGACVGHLGDFCALDAGLAFVCCAGGCTDIATDTQNCGSCGNACDRGASCAGADGVFACACPADDLDCGGGGGCLPVDCGPNYACTNPLTDPQNCGGCGQVCDAGSCVGGVCSP